jgi:hypothetical protein
VPRPSSDALPALTAVRSARQKARAAAGAPISGLPEIGIKKRKPGKPGLRAQFSVSHFANLRHFRKCARIIVTSLARCAALFARDERAPSPQKKQRAIRSIRAGRRPTSSYRRL